MNLLKQALVLIILLCAQNMHAALTKSEQLGVQVLKINLERLARGSQTRPLSPAREKNIERMVRQLEALAKKDPEVNLDDVKKIVETIRYQQPKEVVQKQKEEEKKEEAPAQKPPVQTEEELSRQQQQQQEQARQQEQASAEQEQGQALKKPTPEKIPLFEQFEKHLTLLNNDKGWWQNAPRQKWQQKALDQLKNQDFVNYYFDNNINAPIMLIDAVAAKYDDLLWKNRADEEKVEIIKASKDKFLNDTIRKIIDMYQNILYRGPYWNEQEKTVNEDYGKWRESILNFSCYLSKHKYATQLSQDKIEKTITQEYEYKHGDISSEQFVQLKKHIADTFVRCEQEVRQQEEALRPLQTLNEDFKKLMVEIEDALQKATLTPEQVAKNRQENERKALELAQKWLHLAAALKLSHHRVMGEIEMMKASYKNALETQVAPRGFFPSLYKGVSGRKDEDTTKLQESFNKKLDEVVERETGIKPQQQQPVESAKEKVENPSAKE